MVKTIKRPVHTLCKMKTIVLDCVKDMVDSVSKTGSLAWAAANAT